MPAIDTRHSEMDNLFTLLCIQSGDITVDLAITQAMASMEQDDVDIVLKRHKELKR